jgi:uncharacterized protein (DUF697 family)/predicted GTPase
MSGSESDYFQSDEVTSRDAVDHFAREHRAAYDDMPPVNALIAGPTGVGKSTLVNAVLRKKVAKTGRGRPVTSEIEAWSVDGVPITIFDTPGLELNESTGDVAARIVDFVRERLRKPPEQRLHVFWYCVNAQGNRFLDVEAELIHAVAALLPSIVVLTQCLGPEDEDAAEFADVVRDLLTEHDAQVADASPIRTLALPRRVGAHEYEPFGLEELVAETYRLLPEAVRRAFSNAQGIDLEIKRREARKVVVQHAGLAAGIGAVPIPIPDAAPLLAVQGTMLARITVVMGVELDEATRNFLVKGVLGSGALVQIGRQAASMLLKFVPAFGSAINAGVASALTAALGEAYIVVCVEYLKRERAGRAMPQAEMLDLLIAEFKKVYKRKEPEER